MITEQFRVPEVSCQHCVKAITNEVSTLEGVAQVQVSIDTKLVTVDHTEQVGTATIIAAINEAGYDEVEQVS